MKKIIPTVTMYLAFGGVEVADHQQLNPRIEQRLQKLIDKRFSNVILMTAGECRSLEVGWGPYAPISDRFPIAADQAKDERKEKISFTSGETTGEPAVMAFS